jgi:hypothetical protein
MSPDEKYRNDPDYHGLVDMLTNFIISRRFSPSELREASVLASINYEIFYMRDSLYPINKEINSALDVLQDFRIQSHFKEGA